MSDPQRAEALRAALREVVGMFEDAHNRGDAWTDLIAARLQRATHDPAEQTAAMRELADLLYEAVIAGAWLGELARTFAPKGGWSGGGSPPPDFPAQPGWPWTMLREMADKMPDTVIDPDS